MMSLRQKAQTWTQKMCAPGGKLSFLRYIGPGLLVTIGFIDPGNWATNVSAGASFGYTLLWVTTLSTVFLIVLQHNAAHLGIATGLCLSEAATIHLKPWLSRGVLGTAIIAAVATALAEIMGAAIALNMLLGLPVKIGAVLVLALVLIMLYTNSYKKLERWIIGFVSLIGLSFLFELMFVHIDWPQAVVSWVRPSFPKGAMPIIMGVLGAVVMPHNLYLHSEVIQSRQWNCEDDETIKKQLKFEFADTLFSMIVGWAINSAMILVAASTFFSKGIQVDELSQAYSMLTPLIGPAAAILFALALLFAGISSCITAGMAGGTIVAGLFGQPYDIADRRTRSGVTAILAAATVGILFIQDTFQALVVSQILLSVQLPVTILLQIHLTSSKRVMGKFRNSLLDKILLWVIGVIVIGLNLALLAGMVFRF